MSQKSYPYTFHGSAMTRGSVSVMIKAAAEAGFDGIEPTIVQIRNYLDAGYSTDDINELLKKFDMKVASVGWILDVERQGYEFIKLMKEAEDIFQISSAIGARSVQILSGPADFHAVEAFNNGTDFAGYMGLQGLPMEEQEELTVKNLRAVGELAGKYGLILYFEPLCWAPVKSICQGAELCRRTGLENVKVVVDFFHGYIAGDTPEEIRKLDPAIIDGIHVCDTMEADGVPNEGVIRNVRLGDGAVPIQEWIDAVKATGYKGKWTYESFYRKDHEEDPMVLAKNVYAMLSELVG